MELTARQKLLARKSALWAERSTWFSQYQDLSRHYMPRTGRFFVTDRNRGGSRYGSIINETPTRALRVLAAGLMAGMTSPARPWFRLATPNPDLMQRDSVKLWLNQTTNLMRDVFARSNTYRSLHTVYEELGLYGTAADIVLEDFDDVIRHYVLTAGEYAIGCDYRGQVNTLCREFDMTVANVVGMFVEKNPRSGSLIWTNVSQTVKNLWDTGKGLDQWVTVMHMVEPRIERDAGDKTSKSMPYSSCYIESAGNEDKYLRESGFKRFPALCPRWAVSGGDIYGNSPGMEALGSVKQLQHGESRKALAIDYMVKPPLQMPTELKNMPMSTLPGGVAYVKQTGQSNAIQSMFDVRLDIEHQDKSNQRIEQRINQTMYVDLFLMLAQDDRSGTTAREIAEKHEEKLLMLGPVLERLHNELLKPYIDIVFDRLVEADVLPPPPPELQGTDLNVEFVSMLAQAQKAIGVQSTDRLLQTVGTIATFQTNAGGAPEALDKLDTDAIIDDYADMLGANPQFVVGADAVAQKRAARAKAQQQAQQQQAREQAAAALKTAGDTNLPNATDVINQFSGYTTPQGA